MPFTRLDRRRIRFRPLSERINKVEIERDHVPPDRPPAPLGREVTALIGQAAEDIKKARQKDRPVILAFGAHTIKNGLAPVLIDLMEKDLITHLATNGAGIIHDWEFAYQGASSEDVRENVAEGKFGIWRDTGFYINLALSIGAFNGLGYGESVGEMIEREGLSIPSEDDLRTIITESINIGHYSRAAGALDLLERIAGFGLKPGFMSVPHPYRKFSVQAAAFRMNVPFTGHPMFGHDIIYAHPMNQGAAVGRAAENDFLAFAHSVSNLAGGVYLSIGSAVMSPMIFEKSLSMARNIALQNNNRIDDFSIYVVDLAESAWNWASGEPPVDDPAYYMRYLKTFSRMGGSMHYISADNRDFLLSLCRAFL